MKYFIIPQNDITMEIYAETPEQALDGFVWSMDSDMNAYFKVVTEKEYDQFQKKKQYDIYREYIFKLKTKDAIYHMKNTIEDYIEDEDKAKQFFENVSKEDYEDITNQFFERYNEYDGNVSENTIFNYLIETYIEDKLAEMEYKEE